MNSPGQRAQRTVARRRHVLCVLGLLVGLLGMHGLAPGGGLPRQGHGEQAHASQAAVPRTHGSETHEPPTHVMPCGHCGEGHVQHADATCASGAVAGGPVVPPLVADPVPVGEGESAVRAYAVVNTEGARAPPSLSELQLLRI
ncbi:hypothetical protein QFZ55_002519 [Streptomyces luteogriseus]|uniref:DUF6153 family protein n=1 Tax=Streptomyces luteogriseus TaxID=68233 RepID=UPI00278606AB|nr:DUF6153 family protein [Streptomyces luteogriseus]MDQ0713067.1 hypothetical protein [Streptomyces luteogriseus]